MMFHISNNHLIAFVHECLTEGIRHKIDTLGSATRKDDFGTLLGIEEPLHTLTCTFMKIGGILAQEMDTTMHISIVMQITVTQFVDDTKWLLCGSTIVKINKGLAIHHAIKNRKIPSDRINIQHI